MNLHHFESQVELPAVIETLFEFFSNPGNLDTLTPPWLHFSILTPLPLKMQEGILLDYKLNLHGIPVRWQSRILKWDPPHRFVDEQVKGPYRQWIHTHSFESTANGTLVRDSVAYSVPGWILEPLIDRLLVAPDIRRIFRYRSEKLGSLFGSLQTSLPP